MLYSNDSQHGPLPASLVVLTVVTGLVDAVSYLSLGHVFVANMTGNIVFLGFALAGAASVSLPAAALATAAFALGAVGGGRLGIRYGSHRGRLLAIAAAGEAVLIGAAALLAVAAMPSHAGSRYATIVLLACAMGLQNAVARRIAVPDLTTTVLTLTITGLAADSRLAGGRNPNPLRRLTSVFAMFAGALAGAALALGVHVAAALAVAFVLLAANGAAIWRASRGGPAAWSAAR